MKPIAITTTDYFNFKGINLNLEFMNGASDDGTSGAERFCKNVSEDVWDFLRTNYFFNEELFEKAVNNNAEVKNTYKKALCHQVEYLLLSGDKMLNVELSDIIPSIRNLAPRAKQLFRILGLTNIQPINKSWGR